jgi:predicted GNAT family acetyltransferase
MHATWHVGQDWDEFSSVARSFLAAEPERNTLPITVLDAVLAGRFRDGPPSFGWHHDASSIDGAFLVTPPFDLIVVSEPVAASGLGDQLRTDRFAVPGVNAEPEVAAAFSSTYLAGENAEVETQMVLYRLEKLVEPPIKASGSSRAAAVADFDLCLDWFNEMRAEVGTGPTGDQSDLVRRRIDDALIQLWVSGDEVVSLAGRAPDAAGVARIGPVYTPPQWRRNGFASAVTHACARDAIDAGAKGVVLFTDLANPTSNAIYQTVGFRPIGERVVLRFHADSDGRPTRD